MIRLERLEKPIKGIYRFLPVQLLLLHFRKYQLLLVFWLILVLTITQRFADAFGASTLFLSPEYLGEINFFSMMLLGGAMAVFIMAWHITTFIIHSHRVPFMGATRHAFLKYCINNSILPLAFLVFYSVVSIRFQLRDEHAGTGEVLRYQAGFYLGLGLIIVISFAYFFRVDRDLLKVLLSRITNPARIRQIIPYDSLDFEIDIIRADTYLSGRGIKKCSELEPYNPRFLQTVLRKHHRNAITATIFAILLLLLSGIFMDDPRLRIPAGAGFLILFALVMGMVGGMKYFLRSWETIGWILIILLLGWLVKKKVFDFRGIAFGMDYSSQNAPLPKYDYNTLKNTFTPAAYLRDKMAEEKRLDRWKEKCLAEGQAKPPLIVVSVSGGGLRAAYWSFNTLQYIDSLTHGRLFSNTVLITGASGGMIGAAYWRELHHAWQQKKIDNPYAAQYRTNIGKDLLNAIVFSFASVDMISPFNKISLAGYSYSKDRGYAMEQELISNTEGMLDHKIGDYREAENKAEIPAMIINSTIINDGRRLMISPLPLAYLTQPEYGVEEDTSLPPIDAVDYGAFFKDQNPYNMRITTALRINATFPFILPVVRMPSTPAMNLMDAGLRDNFGMEVATRYLFTMRDWINKNTSGVILLEIRDTREYEVFPSTDVNTLGEMAFTPLFVIQDKWEPFQSYYHGYLKDYLPYSLKNNMSIASMQYIPEVREKAAALNFHLTSKEKSDIYNSIHKPFNVRVADTLARRLNAAQ